jgi:hypothetical protein
VVYDLSHLNPFRYQLKLEGKGNYSPRLVEVRVGFSSHTFTTGCLIAENPRLQYSSVPHDFRRFCPVRYELSRSLPDVARGLARATMLFRSSEQLLRRGNAAWAAVRLRISSLLRCASDERYRCGCSLFSERLCGRTLETSSGSAYEENRVLRASGQGLGKTKTQTTTLKANPATKAGFGRRSSWLSHSWCGPFLGAGRRGIGHCVTR